MWISGFFEIDGVLYDYCAKVYDEPSKYGIDGGRISKLSIYDNKRGKLIINYDRGWDVKPTSEEEKAALAVVVNKYKEA